MLGLEEGVFPQRTQARRSSTTIGAASSTAARGSRSPTRSRAPATSSTRRARDRRDGSISSARRRPTTARRASRARSGRTSGPFSTRRPAALTRRRALSELVWPIEGAPSERERLRARRVALDHRSRRGERDRAARTAGSGGWTRALAAFRRPTRRHRPGVLEPLRSRAMFGVTELEAFAGCSSIWFVERMLDPKLDGRRRSTRACAARSRTRRSSSSSPGCRSGSAASRSPAEQLDEALEFLRECLTRRSPAARRSGSS